MLDLRGLQKTACSEALAGMEEVHQGNNNTVYKGVTTYPCKSMPILHPLLSTT